jgi:holo-[acyl-carrier protein] synthase
MIIGIGIDAAEVERFNAWYLKPRKQLQRVFSDTEIDYCLSAVSLSAERFAVRFAVREAFFKSISAALIKPLPLLVLCKTIWLVNGENGRPELMVDWQRLNFFLKGNIAPHHLNVHCSLSHTRNTAAAVVILEAVVA